MLFYRQCENGGPNDLAIASDQPWPASAAWHQLVDIMPALQYLT
jgi:hypothetical protein